MSQLFGDRAVMVIAETQTLPVVAQEPRGVNERVIVFKPKSADDIAAAGGLLFYVLEQLEPIVAVTGNSLVLEHAELDEENETVRVTVSDPYDICERVEKEFGIHVEAYVAPEDEMKYESPSEPVD